MSSSNDRPITNSDSKVSTDDEAKAHGCDPSAAQFAIGRTATPDLIETIKRKTKAQFVRVLPAGAGATRDFIPGRVNIQLDGASRIVGIRCG